MGTAMIGFSLYYSLFIVFGEQGVLLVIAFTKYLCFWGGLPLFFILGFGLPILGEEAHYELYDAWLPVVLLLFDRKQ